MIYGLIFSAGKETRFKSNKPKALSLYNGTTILDNNITNLKKYCDEIYVVCSHTNQHFFNDYNKIVIDSGLGCGDAVMKAISKLEFSSNDKCYIQWGDCLNSRIILDEICDIDCYDRVIIPCAIEDEPYVELKQYGDKVKVLFSKYGEKTSKGYHDFGLFFSNISYLFSKLCEFAFKISTENGYVHKHNNEMQFLDILNDANTRAIIIEINNYKSLSFNTIEELNNL